MTEEVLKSNIIKKRRKSSLYPSATIQECLEFISIIKELGGKDIIDDDILREMGIVSCYNRRYIRRKSASKQFGLIKTSKNTFALTQMGYRILDESNNEETRINLLKEIFCTPTIYNNLVSKYNWQRIPPLFEMREVLVKEFNIVRSVTDKFAECFTKSALYVGILDKKTDMLVKEIKQPSQNVSVLNSQKNKKTTPSTIPTKLEEGYIFKIPMLNKKQTILFVPEGVNNKDIDYIKLLFDTMVPTFLYNLKNEIREECETNTTNEEC